MEIPRSFSGAARLQNYRDNGLSGSGDHRRYARQSKVLQEHWKYYEELYDYQQNFADRAVQLIKLRRNYIYTIIYHIKAFILQRIPFQEPQKPF